MIGSARAENTGVHAMTFHPDGRTLFCGYDNSLKVFSWEPVICHDGIDMGWSTLGDVCINEGKLIGCSHYGSSIAVWVADLSHIQPYGTNDSGAFQDNSPLELKVDMQESPAETLGFAARSSSSLRATPTSPDVDAKDIKNIYVDYEKPISSRRTRLVNRSKMVSPSDYKETNKLSGRKQSTPVSTAVKSNASGRSLVTPSFVARDSSSSKSAVNSRRDSIAPAKPGSGRSLKVVNIVSPSNSKLDVDLSASPPFDRLVREVGVRESDRDTSPTSVRVEEKCQEKPSPLISSNAQSVYHGRTRSLVEKFEKRGKLSTSDDGVFSVTPEVIADRMKTSTLLKEEPQVSGRESTSETIIIENLMENHDVLLSGLRSRLTKLQMVLHLWERNDVKGAINVLRKLPDHSVQADVISVVMEKLEIISMDLLSCMLPVLLGLLDSKMERHAKLSLELLLKLVALFGPTINSTISAPPSVGVDLHQEERIECCKQCFAHLQQVQGLLPALARKSGSLAKSALELNLVIQDHNL